MCTNLRKLTLRINSIVKKTFSCHWGHNLASCSQQKRSQLLDWNQVDTDLVWWTRTFSLLYLQASNVDFMESLGSWFYVKQTDQHLEQPNQDPVPTTKLIFSSYDIF
jgi:hypothetical protein